MITEDELKAYIRSLAEKFADALCHKKYWVARNIYHEAVILCVDMKLGEDFEREVFGTMSKQGSMDGLFKYESICRCLYEWDKVKNKPEFEGLFIYDPVTAGFKAIK